MEYKNISLPVIIEIDEDQVFIVSCPTFKGCHSFGYTIDEAMSNLREVIEMCLEESSQVFDSLNKYIGMREINLEVKQPVLMEYV